MDIQAGTVILTRWSEPAIRDGKIILKRTTWKDTDIAAVLPLCTKKDALSPRARRVTNVAWKHAVASPFIAIYPGNRCKRATFSDSLTETVRLVAWVLPETASPSQVGRLVCNTEWCTAVSHTTPHAIRLAYDTQTAEVALLPHTPDASVKWLSPKQGPVAWFQSSGCLWRWGTDGCDSTHPTSANTTFLGGAAIAVYTRDTLSVCDPLCAPLSLSGTLVALLSVYDHVPLETAAAIYEQDLPHAAAIVVTDKTTSLLFTHNGRPAELRETQHTCSTISDAQLSCKDTNDSFMCTCILLCGDGRYSYSSFGPDSEVSSDLLRLLAEKQNTVHTFPLRRPKGHLSGIGYTKDGGETSFHVSPALSPEGLLYAKPVPVPLGDDTDIGATNVEHHALFRGTAYLIFPVSPTSAWLDTRHPKQSVASMFQNSAFPVTKELPFKEDSAGFSVTDTAAKPAAIPAIPPFPKELFRTPPEKITGEQVAAHFGLSMTPYVPHRKDPVVLNLTSVFEHLRKPDLSHVGELAVTRALLHFTKDDMARNLETMSAPLRWRVRTVEQEAADAKDCEWEMGKGTTVDQCGVCGGDGTTCPTAPCYVADHTQMEEDEYLAAIEDASEYIRLVHQTLQEALDTCKHHHTIKIYSPDVHAPRGLRLRSFGVVKRPIQELAQSLTIIGFNIRARCIESRLPEGEYCPYDPYSNAAGDEDMVVRIHGTGHELHAGEREVYLHRIAFVHPGQPTAAKDARSFVEGDIPPHVTLTTSRCLGLSLVSFLYGEGARSVWKRSKTDTAVFIETRGNANECINVANHVRIKFLTPGSSSRPTENKNERGVTPAALRWIADSRSETTIVSEVSCENTAPWSCLVFETSANLNIDAVSGFACGDIHHPCVVAKYPRLIPGVGSSGPLTSAPGGEVDARIPAVMARDDRLTETPITIAVQGHVYFSPFHIRGEVEIGDREIIKKNIATRDRYTDARLPGMSELRKLFFENRDRGHGTSVHMVDDVGESGERAAVAMCTDGCGFPAELDLFHDRLFSVRHSPVGSNRMFRHGEVVYGHLKLTDLSPKDIMENRYELRVLHMEWCTNFANYDGYTFQYTKELPFDGGCHSYENRLGQVGAGKVVRRRKLYVHTGAVDFKHPAVVSHGRPHEVYFEFPARVVATREYRRGMLMVAYDVFDTQTNTSSVPPEALRVSKISPASMNPSQIMSTNMRATCTHSGYFSSTASPGIPAYQSGVCKERIFTVNKENIHIYVWIGIASIVAVLGFMVFFMYSQYNTYVEVEKTPMYGGIRVNPAHFEKKDE